jgi:2-oxoglutarate ferredoxin oxidoreductase subunit alpha
MGAVTVGGILLDAQAASGGYGVMTRSYGPQIRGGESAVVLRFGDQPVQSQADQVDVLFCLGWQNVERFIEEIPLGAGSVIVGPLQDKDIPQVFLDSEAALELLDFDSELAGNKEARSNMLAVGLLGRFMGLTLPALRFALEKLMAGKSSTLVAASCVALEKGYELSPNVIEPLREGRDTPAGSIESSNGSRDQFSNERKEGGIDRWSITGNEACAYGALLGGVRFVAAYPITPATELLDWMALRLPQIGGVLVQAEDELASINMIIGASYGGVPALTATSGPGLSLMLESVGLAVASEIPLTIVNVSRGGPSTGIPTKPEQSDFNIAVYGLHGDAPHLVAAPMGISDCVYTTQRMVELAEQLQVPGIVLSDQRIAQARVIMDAPICVSSAPTRLRAVASELPYQRYSLLGDCTVSTADQSEDLFGESSSASPLVSPMSVPGDPGLQYTADGLEHNEHGTPSSIAADHTRQSQKRRQKLELHDYGDFWGRVAGKGELALISWGSSCDAVLEACVQLRQRGVPVRSICLRQLSPLPRAALENALHGVSAALVVELNESGQLFHYLESHAVLPVHRDTLCRPGPLVFRPGEIAAFAL